MVWVEGDLKGHFIPPPLPLASIPFTIPGCSRSNLALNISRSWAATASLSNLLQYLSTLTAQ